MGSIIKALKNKGLVKKITLIVSIIGIALILSGSTYIITLDDATYKEGDESNFLYTFAQEVKNAQAKYENEESEDSQNKDLAVAPSVDGGYKLDINLDQIAENIIKIMDKKNGRLKTYVTGYDLHEFVKKMIKVDLFTTYPDLRSADKIGTPITDPTEFQGAIKFVRHKSDGTTQTLQYIPLGERTSTDTSTLNGLINHLNNGGSLPTGTTTTDIPVTSITEISLDKIFYIGDSWMVALRDNGITDSDSSYFQAEVGASAASPIFDSLNVKTDASAIVIMLGLNNPYTQADMKELINTLSINNPDKPIYVLKVFRVGENYDSGSLTADGMNQKIDQYNQEIANHCSTMENVQFIDATSGLIDSNGYLSEIYKSNEYHLTSSGYTKLYENIKSLIQNGVVHNQTLVENHRDSILDYFSIDNEGNVIVATYNETIRKTAQGSYETEYKANNEDCDYIATDRAFLDTAVEEVTYAYSTKTVNYKEQISKYTMPCEYLWAFLVCGRDSQFISDFADLVLNSKIEISIYDSVDIYEDMTIYSYNTNNWKKHRTVNIQKVNNLETKKTIGEWSSPPEITTIHHYDDLYTKNTTNMVNIEVTNIDIWFMQYKSEYELENKEPTNAGLVNYEISKNTESDETFEESTPKQEDITIGTEELVGSEKIPGVETEITSEINIDGNNTYYLETYKRTDYWIQEKKNQNISVYANNSIQSKYTIVGNPQPTYKTDKTLEEGEEGYPNFCTLYIKSLSAKNNITGAEDWLFEILANNESTVNMVELTKYMLYCATDMDFGVKEYQFEGVFTLTSNSKVYGGTVETKLWFALLDAGYTPEVAAGVMANIAKESGFYTNKLEWGFDSILGHTDESYTEAIDNGSYTLEQFISDHTQENCGAGYGLAQWTYHTRKKGLYNFWQSKIRNGEDISISDANMQIEYLLAEMNPNGGANGYANFCLNDHLGYTYTQFIEVDNPEDAATIFCAVFERPAYLSTAISERRVAARNYYEKYKDLKAQVFIPNENMYTDGYSGTYTSSTGRTYIEYKQFIGPWASKRYGTGNTPKGVPQTVSNTGCYATCLAILASSYDETVTPETMRQRRNSAGSITFEYVSELVGGITYREVEANRAVLLQHLQNGGTIMTFHKADSIYTDYQHYMLILDVNADGTKVYLSNPGSSNQTGWQKVSDIMKGLESMTLFE